MGRRRFRPGRGFQSLPEQQSQGGEATPAAAILLMIATGVLFACLDTSAKYLVLSGMSAQFVAWARFASHLVLVLVLLRGWRNMAVYRAASLPMQFFRAVSLVGSTLLNFEALKTLQLAETTSIFFFAPMLITAMAGPLLGEWAGWRRWLAIGVAFIGVLIITRPGFGAFETGHLMALGATVSYCFYVLLTRKMGARETPESLIFYSAALPALMLLPLASKTATAPPDLLHWVILLSLGVYGAVGHWLLIRAHRMATATALAPYPYLQMIWMILFGYLVFDQLPDRWTIIGATLIVLSGLYILQRERKLRLASTAPNVR